MSDGSVAGNKSDVGVKKKGKDKKKNKKMSAEYWLISAPGDKTCQQTWEILNNTTYVQNSLSTNYKFPIPDLKVTEIKGIKAECTKKRKNLSIVVDFSYF